MQNLIKTDLFELAPINPNVNNIYYDFDSYNKAIEKYFKFGNGDIYTSHDDNQKLVGKIVGYDSDLHCVYVNLNEDCKNFIKPNKYYIGFAMRAEKIENTNINIVRVDDIDYAVIIVKENILMDEKREKEIYKSYEKIRVSGVTNMYNKSLVCKLANISEEEYTYVLSNYNVLNKKYEIN